MRVLLVVDAQRNAIFDFVLRGMQDYGDIRIMLEQGKVKQAQQMRQRFEQDMRLLDEVGWEKRGLRRQFNLAFFKRLLIGDDHTVTGELAEPFDVILGEELRRAAIAQESQELTQAVDEALRHRDGQGEDPHNDQRPPAPNRVLAGATSAVTPLGGHGFSPNNLVRLVGQLSNPTSRLQIVPDVPAAPVGADARPPLGPIVPQPAMRRLGNGVVQRAVGKVMAAALRPMYVPEVQAAVEKLLGHPVAKDGSTQTPHLVYDRPGRTVNNYSSRLWP